MVYLEDLSIEFSETKVGLNVLEKKDETIHFDLMLECEFLNFSHDYVWLEEDVDLVLKSIANIKRNNLEQDIISVDSPGIAFSYEQYSHDKTIYFFTVSVDLGFITSNMGTETLLSITLHTTLADFENWIRKGFNK